MTRTAVNQIVKAAAAVLCAAVLVGCSSTPSALTPAALGPNPALLGVQTAWRSQIGPVDFPLTARAMGNAVLLASSDGTVSALDAQTGASVWRAQIGAPIAAGVGSDGRYAAVVSRENELVTLEAGQVLWRARLSSQVFTAPLVAGERVFVLGADRSVSAFDARSGKRLWFNQRPGEALVLRQAGVLLAVDNTLVAGLSGRLVGFNPLNGNVVWDAPIATPRGTNDIERLVDLVAGVSRNAGVVCVRAFQAAVGCVDAQRGKTLWRQAANGAVGLDGDDTLVYGVEGDGQLLAWRQDNGQQAWSSDRLRFRQLSAPLVLGRSVVVGDSTGLVHFFARADGTPLTRLSTDGSAIQATPLVVNQTMVVVTQQGNVFGFRPE